MKTKANKADTDTKKIVGDRNYTDLVKFNDLAKSYILSFFVYSLEEHDYLIDPEGYAALYKLMPTKDNYKTWELEEFEEQVHDFLKTYPN